MKSESTSQLIEMSTKESLDTEVSELIDELDNIGYENMGTTRSPEGRNQTFCRNTGYHQMNGDKHKFEELYRTALQGKSVINLFNNSLWFLNCQRQRQRSVI